MQSCTNTIDRTHHGESVTHLRFGFTAIAVTLTAGITILSAQAGVNPSPASHSIDSAAVIKAVSDFHSALETGDSLRALSLLANDAVVLESGGIESLSEYRSHHLPEDINFARAVPSKRAEIAVMMADSTAWTAGMSTAQGTFNGRSINSMSAESMVLSKTSNGWKIRQIHWSSRTRKPQS